MRNLLTLDTEKALNTFKLHWWSQLGMVRNKMTRVSKADTVLGHTVLKAFPLIQVRYQAVDIMPALTKTSE